MKITVVAEYHDVPAEGINVISRTLIDDLKAAGNELRIIPPAKLLQALPKLVFSPSQMIVFTHGPGKRTVLACAILRLLSRVKLTWVATRPDLANLPSWLKGRRSAHYVICNRARQDLAQAAKDAEMILQPIGIAPERLAGGITDKWPDLRAKGVPIAIHVGHLRRSRGLERLCEIKKRLGDRIEIVVVASPYFEPAAGLKEELEAAGVIIDLGVVPTIADVYRSADLYLFTPPPEAEGAIELPLGVLEAMACNLPVISTPFGALEEILQGESGVRFAKSQDFAAAVEEWLNDRSNPPAPAGLPAKVNAHRLAERIQQICGKMK